ncbi:MAG: hypothetical protein J6J66_06830 [Clostridia bacterium]|nr:hypothetical protein [Clostridia bacterium]
MDDFERYGDYNEVDEIPGHRSTLGKVLRILVAAVILFVVGFLGFRLVLFDYYPSSIKRLYFNDTLAAYYNATGGEIGAKTQRIRFPYDDSTNGYFFSDHLVVIDGADQLQVSLRLNTATVDAIEKKYGLAGLSRESLDYLSFRLVDMVEGEDGEDEVRVLSEGKVVAEESLMMYRYLRLVFDGVDLFEREDGSAPSAWMRVDVYVAGATDGEPFAKLAVYENSEEYNIFKDYIPSRKERPQ